MQGVDTRARRRHDRQRKIARAIRLFRATDATYPDRARRHDPQKLADNLAFCRRLCCRNQRRTAHGDERLPIQERRARASLDPDDPTAD